MATAEEFAAASWAYKIADPAEPAVPKPAGTMLGYARNDAYNARLLGMANTQKLDQLLGEVLPQLDKILAIVEQLQASGIPATVDVQAIANAVADEFHRRSEG